jgi:hypothetical protein
MMERRTKDKQVSDTQSSKMNRFIPHSLDDIVFFYATKVEKNGDLTWSVDVDPAACLVSMAANTEGLPTVNDLREGQVLKTVEKDRVVYEGRILLSSGIILTVNDKILMLLRDDEAPVDPLKWTSPAGRCDREPFLTALKEFYEEVILFDGVSGKPVFMTYPENHYLAEAKKSYRTTLARKGFMHPVEEWLIFNADIERNGSSLLQQVRTCFEFRDTTDDSEREVFMDLFFPFMDEENNTLELRLLASAAIPDKTEFQLAFCDGEYERTVKLFTLDDFFPMEDSALVGMMSFYRRKALLSK